MSTHTNWRESGRCPGVECPVDVDMDQWMQRRSLELQELSLRPLKEDLADWLNRILGLNTDADTFLSGLETGISLCTLAALAHTSAEKSGVKVHLPQSRPRYYAKAKPKSWYARDNAASFIEWCKELGVKNECLFESDDLVLHRSSKAVVLCLLEVSRIVWKYGIDPPDIVRIEKELEISENDSLSEPCAQNELNNSKQNVVSGANVSDEPAQCSITVVPDIIQVRTLEAAGLTKENSGTYFEREGAKVEMKIHTTADCPDIINDASKSKMSAYVEKELDESKVHKGIGLKNNSEPLLDDPEFKSRIEHDTAADVCRDKIQLCLSDQQGTSENFNASQNILPEDPQCKNENIDQAMVSDAKPIEVPRSTTSSKSDLSTDANMEKPLINKKRKSTGKEGLRQGSTKPVATNIKSPDVKQVVQKKKPNPAIEKAVDLDTEIKRIAAEMQCQDIVERIKDGKYRIFGNNVFIRVLRQKHLMVRIGGGWQVLEHYLERHIKMKQQKQL